ncbi:MAG: RNA polymerase sporulation sigma factor SigH [Lachnospiraceae bacterium]|jgi:RNA polymerase sporulation-specific sigma factor|nr:RNA polymerase sporulation sigma factor SigH [Lachnospiraceae bacterium]
MYGDYEFLSDEELIQRLHDGDNRVTEYIIEKYKDLVRRKSKAMYILGADHEDLLQEGMIGLFKAIRDYDAGRDASFYTFAELCVTRQIYTAVQAAGRKKHSFLNSYVSLYGGQAGSEEEGYPELIQELVAEGSRNPEDMVIDRENLESLEMAIEKELSSFEKQVLELCLTGMSYTEIARVLGKTAKATDNALQRIKTKIRKVRSGK